MGATLAALPQSGRRAGSIPGGSASSFRTVLRFFAYLVTFVDKHFAAEVPEEAPVPVGDPVLSSNASARARCSTPFSPGTPYGNPWTARDGPQAPTRPTRGQHGQQGLPGDLYHITLPALPTSAHQRRPGLLSGGLHFSTRAARAPTERHVG